MPKNNGIEATRTLPERLLEAGILVLTMSEDDSIFAAVRAGARGPVLKGEDGAETSRAVLNDDFPQIIR